MSELTINRGSSFSPTTGKLDDLFNHKFKIAVGYDLDGAEGKLLLMVHWKDGYYYPFMATIDTMTCASYPCNGTFTFDWATCGVDPLTIKEFIERHETEAKHVKYDYSWAVGFEPTSGHIPILNEWQTSLEVTGMELPKKLLIGCGIATVALYGAGSVIGQKKGYLATPLKLAAIIPAGIGAWKGGEYAYRLVKSKI